MAVKQLELLAPAARTDTGQGAALDLGVHDLDVDELRFELEVTAAAGTTPTLDVKIQDSFDGVDWNDVSGGGFAQKTAAGREAINVTAPVARYLRADYVIAGGTPSFTFDVKLAARD